VKASGAIGGNALRLARMAAGRRRGHIPSPDQPRVPGFPVPRKTARKKSDNATWVPAPSIV